MSDSEETNELPEIDEAVVEGIGAPEADARAPAGNSAVGDLGLVMEVPLQLSVELGSARLAVREVLALSKGSIVELDRMSGDPADVYVNGRLIARGELVSEGERVAIRVTELVASESAGNKRS